MSLTSGISRIVFWEPVLSPHKSEMFIRLSEFAPSVSIVCVAHSELTPDRIGLGWSTGSGDTSVTTFVTPSDSEILRIASMDVEGSFHFFSGIRHFSTLTKGIRAIRFHRCRYGILSEPRVREGVKGKLRILHSVLTERLHRRDAAVVLAIGRNGPSWFSSIGYQPRKVIPFAYFVDPPLVSRVPIRVRSQAFRIGFVGRIVKEKGVFDIVEAVALLKESCILSFVGTGPELSGLRSFCERRGVNAEFLGVLPNRGIGDFLAGLDVLALCSHTTDDGWGVVVSESLMCGTPVVATSCVGASVVLDSLLLGRIVPPFRPDLIAIAIESLLTSSEDENAARSKRSEWAESKLSARAGSRFLIRVLEWDGSDKHRPINFFLPFPN